MNTTSYLCAAALLAAGGATFAMPASAANATQAACSSQYQAAKSAGTLNSQKWSDFYSSCAASMKSGSTAAAAPATAAAPPAAQTAAAPAKGKSLLGAVVSAATAAAAPKPTAQAKTSVVPVSTNSGQTTQQLCSTQYQSAKSAGTLNGQKWPAFYSACAASVKSYQEPSAAPAMPTVAAAPAGKAPSVQANYQPPAGMSSGEAAFQQRIHACSAQWQSAKSAGTLPAGSQWPQFWSACNTQLKQQG